MKERAGHGRRGGSTRCCAQLRGRIRTLRVHLVGHSFGGRLVTAAALGAAGSPASRLRA